MRRPTDNDRESTQCHIIIKKSQLSSQESARSRLNDASAVSVKEILPRDQTR